MKTLKGYHGDDHSWTQTFTGRKFWPLSPHKDDLDIRDIAHALSLLNRYTGHTKYFYSIAQHSVMAVSAVDMKIELTPKLKRTIAMHDAAEAYINDIARPVKEMMREMGVGYAEIEEQLEIIIADKYDLTFPFPSIVKTADMIMLATERRDLLATPPLPWRSTANIKPLDTVIRSWMPAYAETMFLATFFKKDTTMVRYRKFYKSQNHVTIVDYGIEEGDEINLIDKDTNIPKVSLMKFLETIGPNQIYGIYESEDKGLPDHRKVIINLYYLKE